MPDKHPKRPRDFNQAGKLVIDIATGQAADRQASPERTRAGAKGGKARANLLTAEQRAEAARMAAQARWRKKT